MNERTRTGDVADRRVPRRPDGLRGAHARRRLLVPRAAAGAGDGRRRGARRRAGTARDPRTPSRWAQEYADANGGGVAAADITFRDRLADERHGRACRRRARRRASSRPSSPSATSTCAHMLPRARACRTQVDGAAPIVVNKLHPMLSGPGCPCFHDDDDAAARQGRRAGRVRHGRPRRRSNGSPRSRRLDSERLRRLCSTLGEVRLRSRREVQRATGSGRAAGAGSARSCSFRSTTRSTVTARTPQYDVIGWVAFHLDWLRLVSGRPTASASSGNNADAHGLLHARDLEGPAVEDEQAPARLRRLFRLSLVN